MRYAHIRSASRRGRAAWLASTMLAGALAAVATTAAAQTPQPAPPPAEGAPAQAADQSAPNPEPIAPAADAPAADATEVGEVVVTGSRIRRNPVNAPTPLIQVTQEQILQSGQANVIDYLADLPALQNSFVPEDTTASLGVGGLSLLDLRGLGPSRTLTLVDGRRHAGAAYFASGAVDVDTIPRLLIRNVEVITGAASAVYGADAVAGVVNFIQRDDVEGLEIDAALGEVNSNGELNRRLSLLWGGAAFDGRLRGYVSAEYDANDAVAEADVAPFQRNVSLYQNDLDPGGTPSDGVLDLISAEGFGSINRARGGSFILSHNVTPSPASDPDIPSAACPAFNPAAPAGGFSTNCFVSDPGFSYVFAGGGFRPLDFGTFRAPAGLNRTLVQNSPDAFSIVELSNGTRLPEQEAYRFQSGFTFDLTNAIRLFGELKYVDEYSYVESTANFFDVGIRPFGATERTLVTGATTFQIGLDNAYLPAEARNLVLNNRRGAALDQRAFFRNYLADAPFRPQEDERETLRGLIGARGEFELGPLRDARWELSYSYSEVEDANLEPDRIDTERYAFAADAVVDTAGRVNGRPGEIVCRVRLLASQGIAIPIQALAATTGGNYAATDPAIAGCTPFNIFGINGVPEAQRDYIFTEQVRGFRMEQQNALAFFAGDLWDFWGAGNIGIAAGLEYRKDLFSGFIGPDSRAARTLLANVYTPTPESSYNSTEAFVEVQVPLLRDLPFVQSLSVTGAYRYADYSQFGGQDVYSLQGSWRVNDSILFRATYGTSIRQASLNELYRGPAQTFTLISDTCDRNTINATSDARVRDNRNRNCAQIGVPASFIDPSPGASVAGVNGPNPLLQPEQSTSHTISVAFTPTFLPGFSMVIDYFDIEIENAINSVGVTTLLALCTDQDALNTAACAQITRDPVTSEITAFRQGFFNYAKDRARGVDFNVGYRRDLGMWNGHELGRLNLTARGTYNIRRQAFTDPLNPSIATDLDSTFSYPRLRMQLSADYARGALGVTWNTDFQSSQEIYDDDIYVANPDSRPRQLLTTGSFTQHDLLLRYDVTSRVRLRGGVVNLFDEQPSLSALTTNDANRPLQAGQIQQFDLFGRRFFVGVNARF